MLTGLHLLKIDSDLLNRAARLEPRMLRSLDAIHLAAAPSLGDVLGAVVTYDSSQATTAAGCGLEVVAPKPDAAGTGD